MATLQEPEVQLAQRLASNEKPIRTKALKKLRKYISIRSHSDTGGFSGDELLKLWKGLFYCLWMQDKPLLQEELSNQISALIHSFHHIDGQLLYLESFLQTLKREWTGIDRLRMDKFFQLVRFMFRQTFEMLKRKNWESSAVGRFLELLTAQLLQSSSGAPCGLQFHILDLYLSELAAVGAAELTADQNLIFIEPFCKTSAKTKDRALFGAICNSILCTIIDQAPFAIDDLMKEVKAAEDSDSGQASEEDDGDEQPKERKSKAVCEIGRKQINGNKSNEEDDDDDDDDDDDELLHLEEDSETEEPCDEVVGPVLQFAYTALADKLFGLASRSSTPSQNRQRLYKIIRVLRDLHEGIFPQDEYPDEVSTDEDDDMFGTRKRMKRGQSRVEDEDEGVPAAKKTKGKKKAASKLNKQSKEESGKEDKKPADLDASNENKKKKKKRRKKKKKVGQGGSAGGEGDADMPEHSVAPAEGEETAVGPQCAPTPHLEEAAQTQDTVLLTEENKQPTITAVSSLPAPCTSDNKDSSETLAQKKEVETCDVRANVTVAEEQQTPVVTESSSEGPATVSGKKKKKKKSLKAKLPTDEIADESLDTAEAEITPVTSEESAEINETTTSDTEGNAVSTGADLPADCQPSSQEGPTTSVEKPTDSTTQINKKSTKKNHKAVEVPDVETEAHLEVEEKHSEVSQDASAQQLKKNKNANQVDTVSPAAAESTVKPLKKTPKEPQTSEEKDAAEGNPQAKDAEFKITMTTPAKKKNKLAAAKMDEQDETHLQVDGCVNELLLEGTGAVSSSVKGVKKKRKIPVTFEYEADELEAASTNGLAEKPTVAKKPKAGTDFAKPSISKKSQKKAKTSSGSASDLITFQMNAAAPPALFCSKPLSGKKKIQTPLSESKKVTFGLKNNKTAEFKKTDRSLLLSPDGSSRVPFDPKQKPKFGVLKSPPTALSARKTPKANRKSGHNTPKETAKRRPSAADFF
ncbi:ribosomal RNA processing protein 1 homolog B-like isoform X2 [Gymnodraco acuticeps]|uniref:Ribosomal RNA processing protein 1 homolog B-like isoform X2 n=1 Tax=Gymnodraco acuticeps TaxID=8218 RepID=A0A6P8TKS3_GYMAC|nr:ribosomal RNA processing protein 1 homolog B-like isoform X2 [Gymnodraco acuticeps]